jgi:predicted transcriptional regulator
MQGQQLSFSEVPDVCRIKHGGHPCSEEANAVIQPHKVSIRWRIYDALATWGPMTLDELVIALNLPIQTASGRVTELKHLNLIAAVPGQTKATRSGCQAAILKVIGEWKS